MEALLLVMLNTIISMWWLRVSELLNIKSTTFLYFWLLRKKTKQFQHENTEKEITEKSKRKQTCNGNQVYVEVNYTALIT